MHGGGDVRQVERGSVVISITFDVPLDSEAPSTSLYGKDGAVIIFAVSGGDGLPTAERYRFVWAFKDPKISAKLFWATQQHKVGDIITTRLLAISSDRKTATIETTIAMPVDGDRGSYAADLLTVGEHLAKQTIRILRGDYDG